MKPKPRSLLALILIALLTACHPEELAPERAEQMRELIMNISKRAKDSDPDFQVIVQNAPDLAYEGGGLVGGDFLDWVDGFTGEVVLYNCEGTTTLDTSRLHYLNSLPSTEWKLILDQVQVRDTGAFLQACRNHEAIGFPRICPVEAYSVIPNFVPNTNTEDIIKLSDARNALVFYGSKDISKSDMLLQLRESDFDVLIIDPRDQDDRLISTEVGSLKLKAHGGRRLVIAYLNLGAAERWRYYFKNRWIAHCPSWLRRKYCGNKDEYLVKYWEPEWHEIMYSGEDPYIDRIKRAGFDGVLLDNVEAYKLGSWAEKPCGK